MTDHERPGWAEIVQNNNEIIAEAVTRRESGLARRCHATDSGGARCTADRYDEPEHKHRHLIEDLPEGMTT